MKKVLKVIFVILLLLIVGIVSIPYLFKGEIVQLVNDELQNNIKADVQVGEIDLGILSTFPNLHLDIYNLKVIGQDTFQGIELVNLPEMNIEIDLMSLISSNNYKINEFSLKNPSLFIKVLENGMANYDIAVSDSLSADKQDTHTQKESDTELGDFSIALNAYSISKANIVYEDASMGISTKIKNLTHKGKGDFSNQMTLYKLQTSTTCDSLYVSYDHIPYLNHVSLNADIDLDCDLENSSYTFKENEIVVNDLPLGFDGAIAMPNENDVTMDISFEAKKASIKQLFSLIPSYYKNDFESLKAEGSFAFNGKMKGTYNESQMPGYHMALIVGNGHIQYPDLPSSINDLVVDLAIDNPTGKDDDVLVNLKTLQASVAENTFSAHLLTKTPISNPYIEAGLQGTIDFSKLKEVMPLEEGESIAGIVNSDIDLKGYINDLEQEKFDMFKANGTVSLTQFNYQSPDMPATDIEKASLTFTPQHIQLEEFSMKSGSSDFKANGYLSNYLAYYMNDDPLVGELNLNSKLINANDWLEESEGEETAGATEESYEVLEIPSNIDFKMNSSIDRILYENKELNNVKGIIAIKNNELIFEDLFANTLDGSLTMSGIYSTQNISSPFYELNMDISRFDLPETNEAFEFVTKLAPILKGSTGKYSTILTMSGNLDTKMEPILTSLNAIGKVNTHEVVVQNSSVLGKLASQLKMDQYNTINLNNVNISYEVVDGKVSVEPFMTNIGDANAEVFGNVLADGNLDFKMNMKIPSASLGSAAKGLASALGGFSEELIPENINAAVLITGPMSSPKVSVDYKSLLNSKKDAVNEIIEEKKEEIKAVVNETIDDGKEKAKFEAQKRAAKMIADAEKKAKLIKDNAAKLAKTTRETGDREARKVENAATNAVAKIAAKKTAAQIRKKANSKADKIEREASQQSDAVIKKAKEQAARIK